MLFFRLEGVNIEAIWSNDSDGNFVFSKPPAGLANAKVRDWWQEAMIGVTFSSTIYISAITRRPCLNVSVPVYKGNNVVGILGADIRLD